MKAFKERLEEAMQKTKPSILWNTCSESTKHKKSRGMERPSTRNRKREKIPASIRLYTERK